MTISPGPKPANSRVIAKWSAGRIEVTVSGPGLDATYEPRALKADDAIETAVGHVRRILAISRPGGGVYLFRSAGGVHRKVRLP